MSSPETSRQPFQIDWLISNLRWLHLLSVAVVLFLDVFVSRGSVLEGDTLLPQVLLLIAAVLYNAAIIVLLSHSTTSQILPLITLVLDALLTIGLVLSSGGIDSPLLFFALFPVLTSVLRFSQPKSLLLAVGVIGGFDGALYLLAPPRDWSDILTFVVFSLTLLSAAVISSFVSEKMKKIATSSQQDELESKQRKLRAAREHSRLTFELASTLSATLDFEKVLGAVLEVGQKGMQELGREKTSQVGAVLLFSDDALRIAASIHLAPGDRDAVLQGKKGALEEALATGEAVVVDDPRHDPELGKLVSVRHSNQVIVVPLRAGFESFGVVIFGSSESDTYTQDLINLLTVICNQAIVALQNARLYEDLREEKERIVSVEEDARKKLARNLHDGPTQNIASIAMQISFLQNLVENGTSSHQISEELERVEDLARRTTRQIRHMLFTLRPLILETQGLGAALEHYIDKLAETDGTAISLDAQPQAEEALDRETQGIVFYIVEEAISNARKHSGADNIRIRLCLQGEEAFVAEVKDDGKGFDPDAVQMTYDRRGSLGMINMQERAEMAGGELYVSSALGQGTEVRLTIPLMESE